MSGPPDIYLDHAASTPPYPDALAAMTPWLGEAANPSGAHRAARAARRAIDDARDQVAELIGSHPSEVVFTSGGTEADNLAILGGVAAAGPDALARCSAVEHPAVLEAVRIVARAAGDLGSATLPVDQAGQLDLAAAESQLAGDAAAGRRVSVVSVMAANNEVGVIQPVAAAAELVRRTMPDALVHTDAVQAGAWVDLRDVWPHVDLLSLSAHKFGGPKGVGILAIRRGRSVAPRQVGGGQEAGRRAGTPPVASIVAMGVAAELTTADRSARVARVAELRDRLASEVARRRGEAVETVTSAGSMPPRLPNIVHLCVRGVDSEALLFLLDRAGVAASAASSCASGAQQRSHVLDAMGVPPDLARGALRLSLGVSSTAADVERAVEVVDDAIARLVGR